MTRRADAFLVALVLAGTWLWAAQQHLEHVDRPKLQAKIDLHEKVLENRAEDPYQYKLWAITHVLEGARRAFRTDHEHVFLANTILSLALLVWLHHAWLRSIAGRVGALAGALTLGALLHTLFLTYYHHPYEFWGVAGFCLLLQGSRADGTGSRSRSSRCSRASCGTSTRSWRRCGASGACGKATASGRRSRTGS